MALLDKANTETYRHTCSDNRSPHRSKKAPSSSSAATTSDDLKLLLEQTDGKGVNVYTHGEMLPAHGYPELKKHPQLKGNFGTAWQSQQKEFAESFPRLILFTTNCLMPPRESYADRVYTTSVVGYPELTAYRRREGLLPRSSNRPSRSAATRRTKHFTGINGGDTVTTGFARNAVLLAWPIKVIDGCEVRRDPAFLPGRRLRRRAAGPELLHRVCETGPKGHRDSDACLRQVPLQ